MSLWFIFCQLQAHATTPIGSSKELLPWTQGRADCPFVVSRGGQVVGAVYCDGGSSGALAGFTGTSPCPFDVKLVDGGQLFEVGCDSSINYGAAPNTGNPFLVAPDGTIFFGPIAQGSVVFTDGGSSTASVASDLGTSYGTAGFPGLEATLALYSLAHSAHITWDGTEWISDRPFQVKNSGVTVTTKPKNGGGWIGTTTNHDLFLGSNDGFGFLQGNASGISLYAPVTMGNRQINSLGVATAATDAAVRNQAIETKDPASGSQLPIKARGHQALIAGAGTHTFSTAFSVAPECTCSTEVADAALACSATTTVITLAGTGTNVVHWNCDGNL